MASIGKQSLGEFYFLGRLFNDSTIPNKHGQLVNRGNNAQFSKVYRDSQLVGMEGLEGNQGSIERDIFNFTTTFALTDIILLHITQADLENAVFLDNFAYTFLQIINFIKV